MKSYNQKIEIAKLRYEVIADRRLDIPKVKDILNEKIIAFTLDFTIFDAIHCLNQFRISSAPVINLKNEVIGYLSDTDCIKSITNTFYFDANMGLSIGSIMTNNIEFAQQGWDIFELEVFFESKGLRSAPVIDENNHLVGIVTRRDILMTLMNCNDDREIYKELIKNPIELNSRERIRMIVDRYEELKYFKQGSTSSH
jgi:predicted transcriptional regulator